MTMQKLLLPFLLAVMPIMGICQSAYPQKGHTEEPAYLLSLHGCTDESLRSGDLSIPQMPSRVALILPPSRFQKVVSMAEEAITLALNSDAQFQNAMAKAKEFKNSGNVAAKNDWLGTALDRKIALTKEVNSTVYTRYGQLVIDNEKLPVYFGVSVADRFKAGSIAELVEATKNRCWFIVQGS